MSTSEAKRCLTADAASLGWTDIWALLKGGHQTWTLRIVLALTALLNGMVGAAYWPALESVELGWGSPYTDLTGSSRYFPGSCSVSLGLR